MDLSIFRARLIRNSFNVLVRYLIINLFYVPSLPWGDLGLNALLILHCYSFISEIYGGSRGNVYQFISRYRSAGAGHGDEKLGDVSAPFRSVHSPPSVKLLNICLLGAFRQRYNGMVMVI